MKRALQIKGTTKVGDILMMIELSLRTGSVTSQFRESVRVFSDLRSRNLSVFEKDEVEHILNFMTLARRAEYQQSPIVLLEEQLLSSSSTVVIVA